MAIQDRWDFFEHEWEEFLLMGEQLRSRRFLLPVLFPWLLDLNLSEPFLLRVGSCRQPLQGGVQEPSTSGL